MDTLEQRTISKVSARLLPFLMLLGWRNAAFADLAILATTVALALLGNAAVCGIISNPHDRYGSRIVWIAAFAVAMATWRTVALTRHRLTGLRSELRSLRPHRLELCEQRAVACSLRDLRGDDRRRHCESVRLGQLLLQHGQHQVTSVVSASAFARRSAWLRTRSTSSPRCSSTHTR